MSEIISLLQFRYCSERDTIHLQFVTPLVMSRDNFPQYVLELISAFQKIAGYCEGVRDAQRKQNEQLDPRQVVKDAEQLLGGRGG